MTIFKYFEEVENRSPSAFFENSFAYYLNDAMKNKMEATEFLNVKHESELSLTFQNSSDRSLYLAIFDLSSSWQIDSFICSSDEGEFVIVPLKNDQLGHSGKTEIK